MNRNLKWEGGCNSIANHLWPSIQVQAVLTTPQTYRKPLLAFVYVLWAGINHPINISYKPQTQNQYQLKWCNNFSSSFPQLYSTWEGLLQPSSLPKEPTATDSTTHTGKHLPWWQAPVGGPSPRTTPHEDNDSGTCPDHEGQTRAETSPVLARTSEPHSHPAAKGLEWRMARQARAANTQTHHIQLVQSLPRLWVPFKERCRVDRSLELAGPDLR